MLQSKYLTEEGLKVLLCALYEEGYKYMYRPTGYTLIYISNIAPTIEDDGKIKRIGADAHALDMHTVNLLYDVFENTNYINLAEALHKVDWSKVPIDTKVFAYREGIMCSRHFAYYKNGKVYTWVQGCTSWSTPHTTAEWDIVELAEEI